MSISIVRLGTARAANEGLRIGTVRRPPRGVPKGEFAKRDYYDVWYPNLSPQAELMAEAQVAKTDAQWQRFARKFRSQMNQGDAGRTLDLLAALSRSSDFAIGCYCEQESHCHRGILRALLIERGAAVR